MGGACSCTGTWQAVETCTWKKKAPRRHNGVMFTKRRVQDGGASKFGEAGASLRSPIQLAQSSIESASVKGSGVKSSKMDLFFLLL